jgi:enoyl-CoA hydratase/carnithine racemase
MVGLIDIAPAVETVDVQGAPVTVYGVSAKGLAHLLGRFPELRMLMTGQEVQTEQLMAMGGDAVAAIIAAGCGYSGDETAEAVAGKLSLDAQADLLAAILRLTLPKGIDPFVEKLTALGSILNAEPRSLSGAGGAPSDTAPASKSRRPSTR